MSEFDERIKSFQKSRDYVRDFFIFGFIIRQFIVTLFDKVFIQVCQKLHFGNVF